MMLSKLHAHLLSENSVLIIFWVKYCLEITHMQYLVYAVATWLIFINKY